MRVRVAGRRVWFEGTGNPTLREEGDANDQQLADRLRELLVGWYGMPDSAKFRRRTLLAVVLVGHLLNQAFWGNPEGDPEILDEAVVLLDRYLLTP
ncbi:hypothetical protein GCM10010193_18580 [Kitasatospora atroaurantiaca]|uniref:hypothetical protein n=1 Tax=Kitasatospora atroaurantiaca TaxID=285545 RepID=UPI0011A39B4E|nr:hypothetical protein [Kitasatospora atroaurantiaca]